ncbi:MAG: alpha-N-arabinofuranosidase [Bacteroidetes bacterium]|nr:MAG: alpha-N-arabinofuranosidase [Bacteroidota bacterium]
MTHRFIPFLIALLGLSGTLRAQTPIYLHPDEAGEIIAPEIYGHFAEHLGRCIYGGIFVGEDSDIPNVRGFRTDVVEALRALQVPVLRWPGGCFADTYHWRDGIGPREDRPAIVNIHWGGVTEDNSFGTHEFLDFCELIGADPYINLNVGSGTVREASEWVEYVTASHKSPMTDLRRQNGREEPWDVKYWGIGNENWGCGGNMRPEYYTDLYRQFASYVRGPLYKIAGGPSSGDYNWMRVFMEGTQRQQWMVKGVSLHHYTLPYGWGKKVPATEFDEAGWARTLEQALEMDHLVTQHSAIMDQYDPEGRVHLIVDEWGTWYEVEAGTEPGFLYQQNTLRDALVAAVHLNIFNQHAERVKMANIAQMVNVLQAVVLTQEEEMVLTPTYYVFQMYQVHQGGRLLPVNLNSPRYTVGGEDLPALHASASMQGDTLHLTIANLDPNQAHPIDLRISDERFRQAHGRIITAPDMQAYNDFGQAEQVRLEDFSVPKPRKGSLSVSLPAKSVVHIALFP